MSKIEHQIGKIKIISFDDTESEKLVEVVRKVYPDLQPISKFSISNGLYPQYIELEEDLELLPIKTPYKKVVSPVRHTEILNLIPFNLLNSITSLERRKLHLLKPKDNSDKVSNLAYIKEIANLARRYYPNNLYSQSSTSKLISCHDAIQCVMNIASLWIDISILDGHRGEERQNEAFRKGYSQLKYPQSKHNKIPSLAVDISPYPINWKDLGRYKLFIGRILMIADIVLLNTEWELISGIDWDDDSWTADHRFLDHPHFELKKRK